MEPGSLHLVRFLSGYLRLLRLVTNIWLVMLGITPEDSAHGLRIHIGSRKSVIVIITTVEININRA